MGTKKPIKARPLKELPPGAMNEAILKGALVIESDFDHGQVAAMTWKQSYEELVKVRGGNYSTLDLERQSSNKTYTPPEENHVVSNTKKTQKNKRESPTLLVLDQDNKNFQFAGHEGAGPSQAHRWMSCTASLEAARAFLETLTPNQQQRFAVSELSARQGTTAHAAAEVDARLMLGEIDQDEYETTMLSLALLPDEEGEAYDAEMGEWIGEYVDLLRTYSVGGHEVLVEYKLETAIPLTTVDADGDPNVHVIVGTADSVVLPTDESPVLTVLDLKYGDGIDVSAEENPQIRIYALGALGLLANSEDGSLPRIDKIEYHIVQPRLGGIKTWEESVDDLLDWRDDVLSPALTEALGGLEFGATFKPSELACQWCPARGSCPALAKQRVTEAAELFDTVLDAEFQNGAGSPLDVAIMSDKQLGTLLQQGLGVTKIVDDLKEEAQRRLHRGKPVPGFHLVSYTPRRTWSSEALEKLDPELKLVEGIDPSAAALLWKRSLISPRQALLALKGSEAEELVAKYVVQPDKRPIIAPEGDRRKAWKGRAPESMFDVEDKA